MLTGMTCLLVQKLIRKRENGVANTALALPGPTLQVFPAS